MNIKPLYTCVKCFWNKLELCTRLKSFIRSSVSALLFYNSLVYGLCFFVIGQILISLHDILLLGLLFNINILLKQSLPHRRLSTPMCEWSFNTKPLWSNLKRLLTLIQALPKASFTCTGYHKTFHVQEARN